MFAELRLKLCRRLLKKNQMHNTILLITDVFALLFFTLVIGFSIGAQYKRSDSGKNIYKLFCFGMGTLLATALVLYLSDLDIVNDFYSLVTEVVTLTLGLSLLGFWVKQLRVNQAKAKRLH